jgi:hypothetical protein
MIPKRSGNQIFVTLFLFMACGLFNHLSCQEKSGMSMEEDANSYIPPLGQLIDSAYKNSPMLESQKALIFMRETQRKSAGIDWGRYMLFFSEMRYGSVDIVVWDKEIYSADPQNTMRYNVGARLQMSIFDGLDLKHKRNVANAQLGFEKSKFEELKKLISEDVIRLWNKLAAYKNILAISEDQRAVQHSNLFYAEQQFKAGDIPLLEYARIKEMSIKAEQDYELTIKEYRETYLLLESLTGVKLSKMNPNH